MFKSKSRPIVVPQSEHLKLVGALAMLWGNADFDLPPIDHNSMIAGMSLHDRGYGFLDNSAIGEMSEETWHGIAQRGFSMYNSDAVADTIVKYHIRRLARNNNTPERQAMAAEFSRAIDKHLKKHNLSRELFDRMDRITDLTDRISFEFCFGAPALGSVAVFPCNDEDREVAIEFRVEEGVISATPWPFSVDEYTGYIYAYPLDGYPERPDPFILRYQLKRA
jgi:hypothetical protein